MRAHGGAGARHWYAAGAGARGARKGAKRAGQGRRARRARSAEQHGRAAWACCWAMGCALGALGLFLARFDSVLFLSQFLDIVREPDS